MLTKTKGRLDFPFFEGREWFSTGFSIYIFTQKKLVQKWISQLLAEEKHSTEYKKITKEVFAEFREFFGGEPRMSSHLQIGDNIFCYLEEGKMKFINLYFDGNSAIKESELTKRFYSKPGKTFFWLFDEPTKDEKQELEESYSEFQEMAVGTPYLQRK